MPEKTRSHLNKSSAFGALAILFSFIPIIGLIFAIVGFYYVSMVEVGESKDLVRQKHNRRMVLVLAIGVCLIVAVYYFRRYVDAMEIQRLLSQ